MHSAVTIIDNVKRIDFDAKTPRRKPTKEPMNHQLLPRSHEEEWSLLPVIKSCVDAKEEKGGTFLLPNFVL